MSINFLRTLDIFIDLFHISLMLFILLGWLIPSLRKVHFVVAIITGLSWLLYSPTGGIGNCILTDLHFIILKKMGETDLPDTYTQYTVTRLTGFTIQKKATILITRSLWLISIIISSILFYRQSSLQKKKLLTENSKN